MKNSTFFIGLVVGQLCSFSLFSQSKWTHTGGPEGSQGARLGQTENYLFAATANGLYRSATGDDWSKIADGSFQIFDARGDSLLVQSSPTLDHPTAGGFFFSPNDGATFLPLSTPPSGQIRQAVMAPHGFYAIAGLQNDYKLWRSTDAGLSWDTVAAPTGIYSGTDLRVFDGRVYILHGGPIARTDAAGLTWSTFLPPLPNPPTWDDNFNSMTANGPNLIVSTNKRLWRSHDDGLTWTATATEEGSDFFYWAGTKLYATGQFTSSKNSIHVSEDFGATWAEVAHPFDYYTIDLAVLGQKLFVNHYFSGIFRQETGAAGGFVFSGKGIAAGAVSDLAFTQKNGWATSGRGLMRFDLAAKNWATDPVLPAVDFVGSGVVSADSSGFISVLHEHYANLHFSPNEGANWEPFQVFEPGASEPTFVYAQKSFGPNALFAGSHSANFRSGDNGATWAKTTATMASIHRFGAHLVARNSGGQFLRSGDNGTTWNNHGLINGQPAMAIWATETRLFASLSLPASPSFWLNEKIFTSTDGATWVYAHDGLPHYPLENKNEYLSNGSEAEFLEKNGRFFVNVASAGIWASVDQCQTWVPIEKGGFNALAFVDTTLFGATQAGVFSTPLPDAFSKLLTGQVFLDLDGDGQKGANEKGLPNPPIFSVDAASSFPVWFSMTDSAGHFRIAATPNATDSIFPNIPSKHVLSISPPKIAVASALLTGNDFAVRLQPNARDLAAKAFFWESPRPGFEFKMRLEAQNLGAVTENGAVFWAKLDPMVSFVAASPAPAVFGDSLVWALPDLLIFGKTPLDLTLKTSVDATLGSDISIRGGVALPPSAGPDADWSDNFFDEKNRVVGSFDPNDKAVSPPDGLTEAEILDGKRLEYRVSFQNTGTFWAENVRITDQLDPALDWASLRLEAASHPPTRVEMTAGGLLIVDFEKIFLPDSTSDEPNSHGFVTFSIVRKKGMSLTAIVKNRASIFFDFNAPVFTNEVKTPLLVPPVSTFSNEPSPTEKGEKPAFSIWPNPTDGLLFLKNERGSGEVVFEKIWLTDALGRLVLELKNHRSSQPVRLDALPDGAYFLFQKMEKRAAEAVGLVLKKG